MPEATTHSSYSSQHGGWKAKYKSWEVKYTGSSASVLADFVLAGKKAMIWESHCFSKVNLKLTLIMKRATNKYAMVASAPPLTAGPPTPG